MRFAIFFFVLVLLLGSMSVFIYRRTNTVFRPRQAIRRALVAGLIGGVTLMFLARFVGDGLIQRLFGVVGGSLTLATIMSFVLMLAAFLIERAAAAVARGVGVASAAPVAERAAAEQVSSEPVAIESDTSVEPARSLEPDEPAWVGIDAHPMFGRRGFLAKAGTGAALAVGASASMYAGIFGRHDYMIEEVPIKLARLPPSLDGFTIVQLSDIHVGSFVRDRELRSALALVDKTDPDIIVLTGDLLDHDKGYAPLLGELVRRLGERAPVVAILGNHDYYAGIGATTRSLRGAGAEVLINQGKLIGEGKLALLGVDDVWARHEIPGAGPDVHSALATMPQDLPRILLCHNPVYFPEASPHVDLQLSGHTHGGQINLGVRPADLLLPYGYVAGHYRRDQAQLWVNRGFGTAGPPARLQAAPEVTKIVLTV